MKKMLCSILSLSLFATVMAAPAEVQNVRFEDQGETIVVYYDLSGESGQKYKIDITLNNDAGRNYAMSEKMMSGDVGKNVTSGPNKTIVWRMSEDYPEGLEGDAFVFSVNASLQKKNNKTWLYVAGGAAVVGVVVGLAGGGGGEKSDKTGMTISVSDQY